MGQIDIVGRGAELISVCAFVEEVANRPTASELPDGDGAIRFEHVS